MAEKFQIIEINGENFEISENFAKDFLEFYLRNGFGSLNKSEIELFIFHLLSKNFKNQKNYEIANSLKITESKLKMLFLNSYMKFSQPEKIWELQDLIDKILDSKPIFRNKKISITIENPVEKEKF